MNNKTHILSDRVHAVGYPLTECGRNSIVYRASLIHWKGVTCKTCLRNKPKKIWFLRRFLNWLVGKK